MMQKQPTRLHRLRRSKTKVRVWFLLLILLCFLCYLVSGSIVRDKSIEYLYANKILFNAMDVLTPDSLRIPHKGEWVENKEVKVEGPFFGGSSTYTSSPDAEIQLEFRGNQIEWIGFRDPNYGYADVYLDDIYIEQVIMYSENFVGQQVLFKSNLLSTDTHRITIKASFNKNREHSLQHAMNVDFFQVASKGNLTRIDNEDPLIMWRQPNHYYYEYYLYRKMAHFLIYFGLAVAIYKGLSFIRKYRMPVTILTAMSIACIDEFMQTFMNGRHSSLVDLAIDGLGVASGIVMVLLIHLRKSIRI